LLVVIVVAIIARRLLRIAQQLEGTHSMGVPGEMSLDDGSRPFYAWLDGLLDAVVVTDQNGLVRRVNRAAERFFGYPSGEVLGRPVLALIPARHWEPTGAPQSEGSGARRRVIEGYRKDGSAYRCELDVTFFDAGVERLCVGVARPSGVDVTERRRAEGELLRRLRQQAAVAGFSAQALRVRDVESLMAFAVEAVSEALACEIALAGETDGAGALMIRASIGWADATADHLRWDAAAGSPEALALAAGEPLVVEDLRTDVRFVGPSALGSRAIAGGLIVVIAGPVRPYGVLSAYTGRPGDFGAEDVHFVQSMANILAEVVRDAATEDQLAQERLFSENLLESLPGVVFLVNEKGRLVRWNKALEAAAGHGSAELGEMAPLGLVPEDEHTLFRAKALEVFANGQATAEGHLRSKDGRLTPSLFSARRVTVGNRPHLLGVGVDISDRRRLEDQLRHSQKMEALGKLAGGVAHDFNNLLTVIAGFSGLSLASPDLPDTHRLSLRAISDAAESAAKLTRQLLVFSRRTIMEAGIIDLNTVVATMEAMLRRLIGEDVAFTTSLDLDLRSVRGDAGLLSQVLMNLAVNARDAMPTGGWLTIETANVDLDAEYGWTHPTTPAGRYVMLAVTDNGCGMSPEVQARAFEPFFTTKSPGHGTGLGLAVVHGIVEQSGARVAIYSELGRGTCFKIYFPAADEAAPLDSAAQERAPALDGTGTVLVVEDEEGVRRLIRLILESHGYRVMDAANGRSALDLLDAHSGPLDLVVTDVVMPGLDGAALARAIAGRFPAVRVLYISGYTGDTVVKHGILKHEVDFLQKPFSGSALAAKVRDVLTRS
jgi:PAS domain S-box-containing protein